MTTRAGVVVQHYGYTAFGHERYKNNTAAFDVTNRYTGQPIDEETGLYFYQSRYYDAELGRFTQADTIVPSANTSQALNRYAYVKNNPLKFSDPSGHGWFSKAWKKIKGYIGTIITVALYPALGPLAAIIGSAVGALVNGGTWKSFAIGAAIGIVAGGIADAIGGLPIMCGVENAIGSTAMNFVAGALTGAVSGAISSTVYGGNWGKNMLEGAKGGAIGAGIGMATHVAVGKLKAWVKGMSTAIELTPPDLVYADAPVPVYEPTLSYANLAGKKQGYTDSLWGNLWKERGALWQGLKEGLGDGLEIFQNKASFGLYDRLGWTNGEQLVQDYGAWGRWSARFAGISRDCLYSAISMRGAAWFGNTKAGYALNHNRYFRIGGGNFPKGRPFSHGPGQGVPSIRIGTSKPSVFNHIDLRFMGH